MAGALSTELRELMESLSHARVMLNNSSFTFVYRAQHSPSKIYLSYRYINAKIEVLKEEIHNIIKHD